MIRKIFFFVLPVLFSMPTLLSFRLAQGGSLDEVVKYGMNSQCGLLVNSSRSIIYADSSENFDDHAKLEAQKLQQEMAGHLRTIL